MIFVEKIFNKTTFLKFVSSIELIFGLLCFFYILSPYRFWEKSVIPNQLEIITKSFYLLNFQLLLTFFKKTLVKSNSQIIIKLVFADVFLLLYVLYLFLLIYLTKNQVNKEIIFCLLSLSLLYVVIRNINPGNLQYYFFILPLAASCQLLYGISEQTQNFTPGKGLSDISGIFFNTGIFGGFISLVFIVSVGLIFYSGFKYKQPIIKYILILSACMCFVLLLSSNSRTAWLSTLLGLSFIFIRKFRRKYYNLQSKTKYLIVLGIATILLFFLCFLYNYKKDSANGRLLIWQISFNMVKDKPLQGFGIDGLKSNYMNYQADYFRNNSNIKNASLADDNYFAYNEFIRILIEQGIIGFLFIIALFYYLVIKKNKYSNKYVGIIFISKLAIFTLAIFCFFSYPLTIFQFKVLLVFFVAFISSQQSPIKQIILDNNIQSKKYIKTAFVHGIISSVIILNFLYYNDNIKPYTIAYKKWDSALKTFQFNKLASTDSMKSVYSILKNDHIFLATYGKALNKIEDFNNAVLILKKAIIKCPSYSMYIELGESYEHIGEFKKAENSWKQASLMIPSKFMPQYLLAKMFFKNGNFTEAHSISGALLKKAIKIYTPQLQQMLEEIRYISFTKETP